jgi:type VI protein secretion system component Hcp
MTFRSILLVGSLFALTAVSMAAETVHLYIKTSVQGQIKGTKTINGVSGWIEGKSIVSPRDVASGQATGKRQHKPFRVEIDGIGISQQFLNALCNNEVINEMKVVMKAPNGKTSTAVFESPKLTQISVSKARTGVYQEVQFTYQKITWTEM